MDHPALQIGDAQAAERIGFQLQAVDPSNANQCLSNCPSGTTASGTQPT